MNYFINRYKEKKFDIYERCVTFDGPPFLSNLVQIKSPHTCSEIRYLAKSISQRIEIISFFKNVINRMILYFKADK